MNAPHFNDPNRADDPPYIVRLIGQVITVTVNAVGGEGGEYS